MTPDDARRRVIEAMDFAAYYETDSSLYDSDKNRLFGSQQYDSGRHVAKPSPWAEGDFEEKMTTLLRWANWLVSDHSFKEAQTLLENDESVLGRIIRRYKSSESA